MLKPRSKLRVTMARILAVLGGGMLVLSAILATAEPFDMPMVQVLAMIDPALPGKVQDATLGTAGQVFWADIALPLLVRPIWMLPVALALLLGGAAFTLSPPAGDSSPDHKRS